MFMQLKKERKKKMNKQPVLMCQACLNLQDAVSSFEKVHHDARARIAEMYI